METATKSRLTILFHFPLLMPACALVTRLDVTVLPTLPSPNNDALNDLVIQRYSKDAESVDSLASKLTQVTLHSTENADKFWTLPPEALQVSENDPELI
jgi:hypothetical protein